jgi:hypothetical protein
MTVQNAAASLTGASTVTATSIVHAQAATHLAGSSAFTPSGEDISEPRAHLVGAGVFFIDPTKVTLLSFFKPTQVTSQAPATIRTGQPGQLPHNVTLGAPVTQRKTQQGGVPNKG